MKYYLPATISASTSSNAGAVAEANEKSEDGSLSSLQESELEEIIRHIDTESKMTESVLNKSQDHQNQHDDSFTENAYLNPHAVHHTVEDKRKLKRRGTLVARDDAKGQFSEMSLKIYNKMSAYDLKITQKDTFPLKVYNSDYLKDALDSFELRHHIRKHFKKLFKFKPFRKAFMYLFWLFVALKFRDRTFGEMDHFNGKDSVTQSLKDNRLELFRKVEADLKVGEKRRVNFIKYWRHKF